MRCRVRSSESRNHSRSRGSKRIPRKNIRVFAGRPMIAHSLEAAQASGLFDRIIVSTDDGEIASLARSLGAETPFVRPPELADAYTGTNAVVQHAIHWLQENGSTIEYACCIYATAPHTGSLFGTGPEPLEGVSCARFRVLRDQFPVSNSTRNPGHTPRRCRALFP